ncbi:MAG: efflux RND transporter periplasmic adaptor subunit [Gammaproteobacteria bacterium]|nr:efflux RND transporter periplasmic adaptor subunit [Gammaproteobacteria bacterium]
MQVYRIILKRLILTALAAWLVWQPLPAQTLTSGTYTVQARPIPTLVPLGGTVIPGKAVTLAAQLPGRVEMIAGEEGDEFDKNAVLVTLGIAELMAKRRVALARIANAEASVRNAGVELEREWWSPDSPKKAPGGTGRMPQMFDELFTERASDAMGIGDSTLDRQTTMHKYTTQLEKARGALWSSRSQLDAIDAKLRDARSLAPFAGVITKKFVEIGDTVQPGMPMLKFVNNELQIKVEVPARLISSLKKGISVPAKLDFGGGGMVTVARIFPVIDSRHHTVTVKFDLPSSAQTRPGQYAEVQVQDMSIPPKYLPVVPQAALVGSGSLRKVYVLNNNKYELRLVRVGASYGNETAILSGLKSGDTIKVEMPQTPPAVWGMPPHNR